MYSNVCVVLDAVMLLVIPRQYVLAQSCRQVCPGSTIGAHGIEIAPTMLKEGRNVTVVNQKLLPHFQALLIPQLVNGVGVTFFVEIVYLVALAIRTWLISLLLMKSRWVTDNEKMAELSITICPEGKAAISYKLHEALERLADTDGDGFLSRDEFDNADQDTTAIAVEYCVPINDEEDNTGTKTYLRSN